MQIYLISFVYQFNPNQHMFRNRNETSYKDN
jgi:hypothetical protein